MIEFRCHQTGGECATPGLCEYQTRRLELSTEEFRRMGARIARRAREEGVLESPVTGETEPLMSVVINRGGPTIIFDKDDARKIRELAAPSEEFLADLAESVVQERGPEFLVAFSLDASHPERPHDSFDPVTRAICMRGTARATRILISMPKGKRRAIIESLIGYARSEGRITTEFDEYRGGADEVDFLLSLPMESRDVNLGVIVADGKVGGILKDELG